MSTSQSEKKANGSAGRMPVHQIVVSPITGLLETHTITIRDEDQVCSLLMLTWSPFADQTLFSLDFINICIYHTNMWISCFKALCTYFSQRRKDTFIINLYLKETQL